MRLIDMTEGQDPQSFHLHTGWIRVLDLGFVRMFLFRLFVGSSFSLVVDLLGSCCLSSCVYQSSWLISSVTSSLFSVPCHLHLIWHYWLCALVPTLPFLLFPVWSLSAWGLMPRFHSFLQRLCTSVLHIPLRDLCSFWGSVSHLLMFSHMKVFVLRPRCLSSSHSHT